MGFQEFDLGRDMDEIAMSMDRRSLLQQIKDLLKLKIENKNGWNQIIQEQELVQIAPEDQIT